MSAPKTRQKHVIVGTAGHIDHGKTRLVARLTDIDTDRLPEEKARGISIDLGFAHWETDGVQFGVVDVPGHERFVRNMVAGATGINVALLVVAADDGVMPQTREHLDIMDLLGIPRGVIAITKTDLVDAELIALVEEEIREHVRGTFLQDAPIVPVSSLTGEGIDELKRALADVAAAAEDTRSDDFFRMPIDRVFSVPGHGTVVTGSVQSGTVSAGDMLELLPEGRSVRVRSVENHGRLVEAAASWQRTAVNLAGVRREDVRRGQELVTPGFVVPTRRMLAELKVLPGSPVTLRDRMELSLHIGTCEVTARVVLKGRRLGPAERGYAELRLKEPVVGVFGRRFILRRLSPATTVAGGRIVEPLVEPRRRIKDIETAARAHDAPQAADRLGALLAEVDDVSDPSLPRRACWRAGVALREYSGAFDELCRAGVLRRVGGPGRTVLLHRERIEQLKGRIDRVLRRELQRQHPRRSLPRAVILNLARHVARPNVLEAVLDDMVRSGELVPVGPNFGPPDLQVRLTRNQQRLQREALQAIAQGGRTPPTVKELASQCGCSPQELTPLLALAEEDGLLVRLTEGLYMTPEAIESVRRDTQAFFEGHEHGTLSELRQHWGISRKFAVPLGELFDRRGVTCREGDLRRPGPQLDQPFVPDSG